jgi:hypothetical protein
MAIQINGTTVISDTRRLSNISSLDSTTTSTISSAVGGGGGGGGGFTSYDTSSSSSAVSSFTLDLDTGKSLHYIEAEFAASTETSNWSAQAQFLTSASGLMNVHYRTFANSSTGSYASVNSAYCDLTYWQWGNLNSTTFSTGERCLVSMWVRSDVVSSTPFQSPYVWGQTLSHDNSGNPNITHFAARVRNTSEIGKVTFKAFNGNLAFHRGESYSVE